MPTTNVFEAVLGSRAIKWDAFWRFFAWLLDPDEGHGLGVSVRSKLLESIFGEKLTDCRAHREFPISRQTDGKGRWADFALAIPNFEKPTHLILMDDIGVAGSGGQRKLLNLLEYLSLAKRAHPDAKIRVVAVSDARISSDLAATVYTVLGDEAVEFGLLAGWKLLPLSTIGSWIGEILEARATNSPDKMEFVLRDFIEWCQQLTAKSRPIPAKQLN